MTTLFNMDGSLDSTEIAFLWLVIFGVLVLFGFVIYLLCRSFTLLNILSLILRGFHGDGFVTHNVDVEFVMKI